jgi:hypothetical protein
MLAVLIIVILFYAFIGATTLCRERLRYSRLPFTATEFWIENLAFLSFYLSSFALLYLAAAAQLTFTSENRSTPLRWAMLAQQLLWIGWFGYAVMILIFENRGARAVLGITWSVALAVAGIYWFVMGSFMSGEAVELSPRIKRRLPISTLGRAFLTWFNPGPGTGYLFAISNVVVMAILAIVAVWYSELAGGGSSAGTPVAAQQIVGILLLLSYFIVYLGLGNLLLRLLRRFTQINLAAAVLVNALLVLAGWGIPAMIDPYNFARSTYNLDHITDPFWSMTVVFDSRAYGATDELLIIVAAAAAAVFLFNLFYIVPEIQQHRIAPPPRVVEEESEATTHEPTETAPKSPWD